MKRPYRVKKRIKKTANDEPLASMYVGRMINAVPVWVEGEPKVSGLYIAACFGNDKRDVLTRLSVADTHTVIGGEAGTRIMDNVYYFNADAKPGETKWQNSLGFYDNGVTHYLDFEVEYNTTAEQAAKQLNKEKKCRM